MQICKDCNSMELTHTLSMSEKTGIACEFFCLGNSYTLHMSIAYGHDSVVCSVQPFIQMLILYIKRNQKIYVCMFQKNENDRKMMRVTESDSGGEKSAKVGVRVLHLHTRMQN